MQKTCVENNYRCSGLGDVHFHRKEGFRFHWNSDVHLCKDIDLILLVREKKAKSYLSYNYGQQQMDHCCEELVVILSHRPKTREKVRKFNLFDLNEENSNKYFTK